MCRSRAGSRAGLGRLGATEASNPARDLSDPLRCRAVSKLSRNSVSLLASRDRVGNRALTDCSHAVVIPGRLLPNRVVPSGGEIGTTFA
jgi:hypothetical protein